MDTNYCWVRLRWEGDKLYLKDYTCNLNAGEGLIIDIPEPSPVNIENETWQPAIISTNNSIQIQSNIIPENGIIQLVDMQGRIVYATAWNQKKHIIETDLPSGLYILTIQDITHNYSQQIALPF